MNKSNNNHETANGTKPVLWAGWFDATKVFPPFDKRVLGYYTLPATDRKGKKTGEIFEYYAIVMCESVTESSNRKSALWRDSDYNTIEPIYWCDLPCPPTCP
jgi:hypothetical protein